MQERVKPSKKKLTVEIDATLAAAALAKGIDPALELERTLRRLLGAGQGSLSDEDRAGIEALDRYIAQHGKWTDGLEKL